MEDTLEVSGEDLDLDKFLSYVDESEVLTFSESTLTEDDLPVNKDGTVTPEKNPSSVGEGNPQEEPGASKPGAQTTKPKKDRTNAARCKRHRLKQKFLKEQVYVDNQELKKERVELLKTISDLELEVDSLRCRGLVDLGKENKLLREAIANHQQYINQVVQIALKAPKEVDSAEHTRLMKTGVENGARHIIGLAYGSIHSELWKEAKPFPFVLDDGSTMENIRVWYQYLPVGVVPSEARRINVRYDLPPLPLNWEKLAAAHWKVASSVEILQKQIREVDRIKHLTIREVGVVKWTPLPV